MIDQPPATHRDADVRTVVAGLMRVIDVDEVSDQLVRIYGRRRATEVLVSWSEETRGAPARPRPVDGRRGPTDRRSIRPPMHPALAPRPGTRRSVRGTRPTDWL